MRILFQSIGFLAGCAVGVLFLVPFFGSSVVWRPFPLESAEQIVARTPTSLASSTDPLPVRDADGVTSSTTISSASSTGSGVGEMEDVVLTVKDQSAGSVVLVSDVHLGASTWIAVQDLSQDKKLGKILGAIRRPAGDYSHLIIELLRDTQVGNTYAVTMYEDDGTGVFSPLQTKRISLHTIPFQVTFSVVE
jgi:hypothetical protein